jgi:hypothetical protein
VTTVDEYVLVRVGFILCNMFCGLCVGCAVGKKLCSANLPAIKQTMRYHTLCVCASLLLSMNTEIF